jgi:hypothetical protein
MFFRTDTAPLPRPEKVMHFLYGLAARLLFKLLFDVQQAVATQTIMIRLCDEVLFFIIQHNSIALALCNVGGLTFECALAAGT